MFTSEQLEIRDMARDFARGELRPRTAEWDEGRALDDVVFRDLAELGFMGLRIPEEHGGLELDPGTYLLILEELAWGDPAVGLSLAIHNGPVVELLLRHGSRAQREAWLPRLASGEALGAFALSEPGVGSDAGAVEAEARREGEEWVLAGRKAWVTNGDRAGLVATFLRTAGDGRVSAFLIPRDTPGYAVGERERTMGMCASETVEVGLDGVRLPADALLGEEGRGLAYALEALDVGRLGIAAQSLGIARAAFEHAAAYGVERKQFERPIAEFGAIQAKLADMATRVEGARALIHQVGAELEARTDGGSDSGRIRAGAAMAKLAASEAAMWVSDQAVQIFGGYGYMRDYPVEKLMRDAKATEIYEGTSEILRHVVARETIREARERTGG